MGKPERRKQFGRPRRRCEINIKKDLREVGWGHILVGKPEGRRPLGRLRRKREDNIKTYRREVGWDHGLDQSG